MNKTRKINIISNKNLESKKTSTYLNDKLSEHDFVIPDKYDPNAELNICVGGDGAFLRAVHKNKFPSIPFIGINTGHLGFFQEIAPKNLDDFILQYINNNYTVEEIFLVNAEVFTQNKKYYLTAINEIVIKGMHSKIIHLDLFIDGNHLERFSGDGIIISTPVGSTAYNLSAGGSIIYPSLKALQITPLAPRNSKAYRSFTGSIVVPGDLTIKIEPEVYYTNTTLILNDGVEFKYNNIKYINLKIPDKKVYRLNFDKNIYWNNLKSKFL